MIYVLLTVVLMVIDQVIKWLVTAHLSVNQTTTMIPGIFDLTNLHNTGAAWSMLEGQHDSRPCCDCLVDEVLPWAAVARNQSLPDFGRNPGQLY